MKQALIIITLLLLISCGGEEVKKDQLSVLKNERDSLREIQDDIRTQIKKLDKRIDKLDVSAEKKKTLVATQKVSPKTFQHFIEVHGILESSKNVNITSEVSGIIKTIKIKEGERVKKGDPLIILDTELISGNIEEVETSLDLARTVYEKQKKLWEQNIGSEIQYLEAKNRMESLEKKLATLRAQGGKGQIQAPFSGVVDEIFAKEGEMAMPQIPLVRLINLDDLHVKADVSEQHTGKIGPGTGVKINFSSIDTVIETEISRVGQYINPNNRTFQIRVDLRKANRSFKPNLLANMQIKDFEKDSSIVLPSGMIQQDAAGNSFVFRVKNTEEGVIAVKTPIETGMSYEGETLITGGLSLDDIVVTKGGRSLKDQEEIRIR